MNQPPCCSECGCELSANQNVEMCPKCLLALGLTSSSGSGHAEDESEPLFGADSDAATIAPPTSTHADDSNVDPGNEPAIGSRVRYFGDYELLEEIARGGMGVVYKARQVSLNRTVAVKMILAGQLAREEDVQRFYAEAEAAAQLDHPGIVPIYEVGEQNGQHYFSMGFVEGESLAEKIKDGPLSPVRAAKFLKKITDAIAYAHARGVIHRDLKPSNVVVDRADEPKVTDFGLAKKLEAESSLTASGQVIGTPGFMPPEQAKGNINEITRTSDVYSLGALLFALLTGRSPFASDSPVNTILQVVEKEPVAPRILNPRVPIDLQTICLKCLEKDQTRRFQTADELGMDISRFLAGEPISARPVSRHERFWRWCYRKPALAAALGLCVASLLTILIVSLSFAAYQYHAANALLAEQERTKTALRQSRQLSAQLALDHGLEFCEQQDVARGMLTMAKGLAEINESSQDLEQLIRWNLGIWQRFVPKTRAIFAVDELIQNARLSPDGRNVVSLNWNHPLVVWNTKTGRRVDSRLRDLEGAYNVAFSQDSKRFALSWGKKSVRIWDSEFTNPLGPTLEALGDGVLALSPNGSLMAAGGEWENEIDIWDPIHAKKLASAIRFGMGFFISNAKFSPDGKALFLGYSGVPDENILGALLVRIENSVPSEPMNVSVFECDLKGFAFSPNSQMLAIGNEKGAVHVFDTKTGNRIGEPLVHSHAVHRVRFLNNEVLMTCTRGGVIRQWNLTSRAQTRDPLRLSESVFAICDDHIVMTTDGQNARFWNVDNGRPLGAQIPLPAQVEEVEFDNAREIALLRTADGTARLVSIPKSTIGEALRYFNARPNPVFSDDGRVLIARAANQNVQRIDTETGALLSENEQSEDTYFCWVSKPANRILMRDYSGSTIEFRDMATNQVVGKTNSTDSKWKTVICRPLQSRALTLTDHGHAQIWDVETGRRIGQQENDIAHIRLAPNGTVAVTVNKDQEIRFWNTADGEMLGKPVRLPNESEFSNHSFFSQNGRYFVVHFALKHRYQLQIWDRKRQAIICPTSENQVPIRRVTFNQKTNTFYTTNSNGLVRIWDGNAGKAIGESFQLPDKGGMKGVAFNWTSMDFSATSNVVFVLSLKTGFLLDGATLKSIGSPLAHPNRITCWDVSSEGNVVVTGGEDGIVHVREFSNGREILPPLKHRTRLEEVRIASQGRILITHTKARNTYAWDLKTGKRSALPDFGSWLNEGLTQRCLTVHDSRHVRILDLLTGKRMGPRYLLADFNDPDWPHLQPVPDKEWKIDKGNSFARFGPNSKTILGAQRFDLQVFPSPGRSTVRYLGRYGLWRLDPPLWQNNQLISDQIQAQTGMELTTDGSFRWLTTQEWHGVRNRQSMSKKSRTDLLSTDLNEK